MNQLSKFFEPWIALNLQVAVSMTVLVSAFFADVRYPQAPIPPEAK